MRLIISEGPGNECPTLGINPHICTHTFVPIHTSCIRTHTHTHVCVCVCVCKRSTLGFSDMGVREGVPSLEYRQVERQVTAGTHSSTSTHRARHAYDTLASSESDLTPCSVTPLLGTRGPLDGSGRTLYIHLHSPRGLVTRLAASTRGHRHLGLSEAVREATVVAPGVSVGIT